MVIDDTLAEDPELLRVAASTTLLAVENGALEGELRASRARILEAGHAERRRIERDLHDSAQQRLVALRIHLTLVGEQLDHSGERAMLERLGLEVDEAIDELRDVARGVYPQVLADAGLAAALNAVAARAALPVGVRDQGLASPARFPVRTKAQHTRRLKDASLNTPKEVETVGQNRCETSRFAGHFPDVCITTAPLQAPSPRADGAPPQNAGADPFSRADVGHLVQREQFTIERP